MTTAEQLHEEAERMKRVPGIIFVDELGERVARVAGTGLEVFEVIGTYLALDKDLEGLLDAFHWLTGEQILAALRYWREYPEEIEAINREGDALIPEDVRRGWDAARLRLS